MSGQRDLSICNFNAPYSAVFAGAAGFPRKRHHVAIRHGESAVLRVAEKSAVRKLSRHAKDFLRTGDEVWLTSGESFYEPEEN